MEPLALENLGLWHHMIFGTFAATRSNAQIGTSMHRRDVLNCYFVITVTLKSLSVTFYSLSENSRGGVLKDVPGERLNFRKYAIFVHEDLFFFLKHA